MIELGQKVKDSVTGFTGVALGRSIYLYEESQIQIQSEFLKDGLPIKPEWFAESRVKLSQESSPIGLRLGKPKPVGLEVS